MADSSFFGEKPNTQGSPAGANINGALYIAPGQPLVLVSPDGTQMVALYVGNDGQLYQVPWTLP